MKTLNELTVGTKLEELEYMEFSISIKLDNVTVLSNQQEQLVVETPNGSEFFLNYNEIINYVEKERVITVSYKKAEDEKEKTYPNWVVAKETQTHILITKEINGNNLYRNLIKSKIKELKEMN